MLSLAALLPVPRAFAQSTLDGMLQAADFVFEGVVTETQNRMSAKLSADDPEPTPYTFVTYRVSRILKGSHTGPTLTLRFKGGAIDEKRFVHRPGQPQFDVGDHDILLVKGNGYLFCPLVNCAEGRFRYIGGLVVNEYGQTIEIDHQGRIVTGKKVDLPDVNTHKVSGTIATERRSVTTRGEDSGLTPPEEINRNSLPTPQGFTAAVEQNIYRTHDAATLANPPPFNNLDQNKAFVDELVKQSQNNPKPLPDPGPEPEMPADEKLERMLAEKYRAQFIALRDDPDAQARFVQGIRAMYPDLFGRNKPLDKKEAEARERRLRAAIRDLENGREPKPPMVVATTGSLDGLADASPDSEASTLWIWSGALAFVGIIGAVALRARTRVTRSRSARRR